MHAARSCFNAFEDLETLVSFLVPDDFRTVICPLVILGITKDQFVTAVESAATTDSPFRAVDFPLTKIPALVASDTNVETYRNFYVRRNGKAPLEPIWKLLSGIVNKSAFYDGARHHKLVKLSVKQIKLESRLDIELIQQSTY
jgi:hypothetical protein